MTDTVRVGLVVAAIFAASAVNSAWLPLWFVDRGLSPAQVGAVLGGAALMRVVGVPGGGWLADRLGRRRAVVLAAAVVAAGAAASLSGLHGLGELLVATSALYVAGSLLPPLLDAMTLALARDGRLEYGRTRAWGSVSYMAATAGAGVVLGHAGTPVVPLLLAAGYGAAACGAALLPEVAVRPRRGGSTRLLEQRAFRHILVAAALVQGSHAAYYGFAAVHWRAAGIGDTAIGLLIAEGILVEVGLFLWGRPVVERLGAARLTGLAACACAVRWTATALTVDLGALACIQLLHAATFACQHLSTMQVMRRLPPDQAGMAQTLLSALGGSLSMAVLSWTTGQLYGPLGGKVFLLMAVVGGGALLVVPPMRRALAS